MTLRSLKVGKLLLDADLQAEHHRPKHGDQRHKWQEGFCYFVICQGVVENGARMEKVVQNIYSLACKPRLKHCPICHGDPLLCL